MRTATITKGMTLSEAVEAVHKVWPDIKTRCRISYPDANGVVFIEPHADGMRMCEVGFSLAGNGIAMPS